MAIVDLIIRPDNEEAHIDLEKMITLHKGQWLHFELRYSGGKIVDLVVRKYKTYESFAESVKQE